jgi:hypothetical protein
MKNLLSLNEIWLECNYLRSIILFDLIMCNEKIYNYILICTLYLYRVFCAILVPSDTWYIPLKVVLEKIILSISNHCVPSVTLGTYILYNFIYLYLSVFVVPECFSVEGDTRTVLCYFQSHETEPNIY